MVAGVSPKGELIAAVVGSLLVAVICGHAYGLSVALVRPGEPIEGPPPSRPPPTAIAFEGLASILAPQVDTASSFIPFGAPAVAGPPTSSPPVGRFGAPTVAARLKVPF
jgi:hypothetical protein